MTDDEKMAKLGELLDASRNLRASVIPATSTASQPAMRRFLETVAAFDPAPCDHPRSWRVYFPPIGESPEVCGYCGVRLDLPVTDATSSSPL